MLTVLDIVCIPKSTGNALVPLMSINCRLRRCLLPRVFLCVLPPKTIARASLTHLEGSLTPSFWAALLQARFGNNPAQSDTCYEPSSIACSGVVGHTSLSDMVGVTCCVGVFTTPNTRVALARGVACSCNRARPSAFAVISTSTIICLNPGADAALLLNPTTAFVSAFFFGPVPLRRHVLLDINLHPQLRDASVPRSVSLFWSPLEALGI